MFGEMEYCFLKIKKNQIMLGHMTCDQNDIKEFLQIIIKLILLEENH